METSSDLCVVGFQAQIYWIIMNDHKTCFDKCMLFLNKGLSVMDQAPLLSFGLVALIMLSVQALVT